MNEISTPPKKVRLLHVDVMSHAGAVWSETLRLDEGDELVPMDDSWIVRIKLKTGLVHHTIYRAHTFMFGTREELVEVAPLYVPTEHKEKAPEPRKVGRRVEVVN